MKKRDLKTHVVLGRGCQFLEKTKRWSREDLLQGIGKEVAGLLHVFRVEEKVTSTNELVADLMNSSSNGRVLCLAEEQTQGRGRRDKRWYSPAGSGFYGSIGWTYESGLEVIQGLSLAVGVVAARCLRQHGVEGVQLKWPNDLVITERKLGGILIEAQAEAGGPCKIVVGVGINIDLLDGADSVVDRPITDVTSNASSKVNRDQLGADLIREIVHLLQHFPLKGFTALKDEWLKYDALLNAKVTVTGGGAGQLTGIACGINDSGALILQTSSGKVAVFGGEVSVRKANNDPDLLL